MIIMQGSNRLMVQNITYWHSLACTHVGLISHDKEGFEMENTYQDEMQWCISITLIFSCTYWYEQHINMYVHENFRLLWATFQYVHTTYWYVHGNIRVMNMWHLCNLLHTIYVFIFMGVKFRGFCGHLVIHENNIFVNPRTFFTLWIHENFSCSIGALLAQWSISFKALPYSLLHDDGAIKNMYYFFIFYHWNSKRIEFFPFSIHNWPPISPYTCYKTCYNP